MPGRSQSVLSRLRSRGKAARLARDRSGVAALEFALVGPAFIALLMAILNTILVYLAQEGLETATEGAARMLLTGEAQTLRLPSGNVGMSAADFKTAICTGISGTDANGNAVTYASQLPPMLDCSRLTVNVTTAAGYTVSGTQPPTFTYSKTGAVTSTGTGYNPTGGGPGQNKIVILQLVYLWPTTKGLLGFDLSNQPNGDRMLVATEVLTTEDYNCASSVAVC